ncbi:hypothetical protein HNV08_09025 [Winogradskyella eckloniae]|uniref:hypothetical protein n=1 Tax=Winogradskyella eckloniae TaxID=1089306 RepID=UPI0015635B4F|nr:hypothetical protein [Winogradskyella eckloniae]NRD20191.1 hypothetical protein [Winogradskyella eckloniae]
MNHKTVISSLFKGLAIVLVLAVLLPSAVKLNHVFSHHSHKVCDNDDTSDTHFHETDFDCDFYKFKLTNNLFVEFINYEISSNTVVSRQLSLYYISLNNYLQTTRFDRGPPQIS